MKLVSRRKIAFGKCEKPENTVKRLEAVIGGLHEYRYVERKVSDRLYWSALFVDELGFRSMGKGISPILCKAGALAEAAEWLTSRDVGTLPGYVAAYQEDVKNAVTIEDLLSHVSTATPQVIGRIKNADDSLHWVDGYSLMSNKTVKVPIEFVRRISGPSGVAAGNYLEEAIVHGTNEVFERRALIAVLKNKLVVPTIDIKTIKNRIIREQIDFIKSKGIEVYIKDVSFGGELPCIGAYFLDPHIPEDYQFHHFFKVGTSFSREDALIRAFTEYVQGRRANEFIKGRKSEQARVLKHDFRALKCTPDNGDNFLSAFMFGFVPYTHAGFLKEGELVPFDKGDCFEDCLDDIRKAKSIFKKLGKDYIVVDWTDPKIGFPVIQVIVPGYSDVLPYHPASSRVLFERISREDILKSYDKTRALKFVDN
jgi:YcaO-like protein with predicted kinase domain